TDDGFELPFVWEWAGERLVMSAVNDSAAPSLHRGDEVLAIQSEPVARRYAALAPRISAATAGYRRFRALSMLADARDDSLALVVLRLPGSVAFLIDGRAISYAETWLGIVEHYRMGVMVGEPTAGTNGNVNTIGLPGGYFVRFTGMKVLKHGGSRHHGVGIHP